MSYAKNRVKAIKGVLAAPKKVAEDFRAGNYKAIPGDITKPLVNDLRTFLGMEPLEDEAREAAQTSLDRVTAVKHASTGPEMQATEYVAPDRKVLLSDGKSTRLSSFWQDRPVALVFLRQSGCPFARRQAVELRREQEGLKKAGIDVVLVGCGSPESAEAFRRDYGLPFPMVCDPDGVLYKKYGLKDMDLRDIFNPSILLKTVGVLAEGYGHGSEGPELQLGGVFVVDRAGKVRFAHQANDATYMVYPREVIRAAATLKEKAAPKRARPRAPAARPVRPGSVRTSGKGVRSGRT
jgi:peroxiredoxin